MTEINQAYYDRLRAQSVEVQRAVANQGITPDQYEYISVASDNASCSVYMNDGTVVVIPIMPLEPH